MKVVPKGQLGGTVATGGSLQTTGAISHVPAPLHANVAQPLGVPHPVPLGDGV